MEKENIGWVGLGKMGLPMTKNLLEDGYGLRIYDKAFDSSDSLYYNKPSIVELRKEIDEFLREADNAVKDDSVEKVGNASGLAFIMVPYSGVRDVAEQLASGMKKAKRTDGIVIDGGNSDPRTSKEIAKILSGYGVEFLDVGFSGGPSGAKDASMAIMAGGDEDAYKRVLPILQVLGKPEYVGPSGSGHSTKMLHNCLEQIYMMGIGEITSFAKVMKLKPKQVARIMNNGLCQSKLLELYQEIPERDIDGTVACIDGGEYSRWASEIANEKDFPLPFTALTYEMRKFSRKSDYRSFAIQAQLRKKFGGHKAYTAY